MISRLILLVAGAAAISASPLIANAQAQAPQRTTATYQDWTLRCETRDGPPAVRSCEMVQSTTAQGQPGPVTQIAIGRVSKTEPMKMVFQVPVNVLIPAGVNLVFDDKEKPIAIGFRQCIPAGCFADTDLKDDLVKKLRTRTTQGRFEFKDAAQRAAVIPVSFKGFGEAFDALSKE